VGEGTLLIRADADVAMGTGHVMRCLALAQAWQDTGGRAVFAMTDPSSSIRERLLKEAVGILEISALAGTEEDARQTAALAREQAAAWVVVDGYQFGADYQRVLKSAGFKILFVDDYGHATHYCADLVLNQNLSAHPDLYRNREPYTRLLLGPQYCLLRREFNAWWNWRRETSPIGHRVLVTMGGSDPENFTERVIDALNLIEDENLEATIVAGGSNARADLLERKSAATGKKIALCRDVSNMAELMAWVDVAVSAAGTTCWEICLMGLPALLIDLAENQTAVARELDRLGCAIHLGGSRDVSAAELAKRLKSLLSSKEDREAMSLRGRGLVDGRGTRVVAALRGGGLHLRPAQQSDSRLLWEWANDSGVRAAAFSSAPIPWEQHVLWFTSKMRDPACRILIAEDGQGRAVGQFRMDWRTSDDADIDVSLSTECRGAGYGRALIDLGVSHALAERRASRLHAWVKPENQASRRSFELAGFGELGEERVNGQTAVHYVRSCDTDQK
jgi:UDP-2,4-diacetamido-2,4,6-trideoxy-beta-L-altropyranose hydrolase